MPTLAELRAQSGPKPLPRSTKVVTLVEGQHLLAEAEKLADESLSLAREANQLQARVSGGEDGERTGEPVRAGEAAQIRRRLEEIEKRQTEIRERQDGIVDDLGDVQGEVGLTGLTGGEWQRFKEDNPPRKDNAQDLKFAAGVCDSAALFGSLRRFVTEWDGEKVGPDDWDDWLAERITYADRRDLVPVVVQMHEAGLARSPKFRSASATTSRSESA